MECISGASMSRCGCCGCAGAWNREACRVLALAGELNRPLAVPDLLYYDVRDLMALRSDLLDALQHAARHSAPGLYSTLLLWTRRCYLRRRHAAT